MLHILGMVLKGIGITLLCILLLLLFLLLAILFVPVRYRIAANRPEAGNARAKGKVSWLFSIVTAFAEWEGRLHYGVRIFGFSIYDNLKKAAAKKEKPQKRTKKKKRKKEKEKKEKEKKKKEPQEKARAKEQNREAQERQFKAEQNKAAQPQAEKREQKTQAAAGSPIQSKNRTFGGPAAESEDIKSPETSQEETSQKENTEKRSLLRKLSEKLTGLVNGVKALFRKLAAILRKIAGILQKIAETPEKLNEKAEELKEKWESYRAFLEREDFKRSVSLCKKQLFYIWRKVKPRKFKVRVRFGFDDPSVTGQILAYAGMLYPLLGKDMMIEPDFEREILEGSLLIKGRITVVTFVRVLCVLYFNRDIKRMIHIWKTRDISE